MFQINVCLFYKKKKKLQIKMRSYIKMTKVAKAIKQTDKKKKETITKWFSYKKNGEAINHDNQKQK